MEPVVSTVSTRAGSAGELRGGILAVLALCLCATFTLSAQTPRPATPKETRDPEDETREPLGGAKRPYRALFGGASTAEQPATSFAFSGSAVEVFDNDQVATGTPQLGGLYTNLGGDLQYGHRGSRTQVSAIGGANVRYYSQLRQFLAADYRAGVDLSTRITPRTTLFATEFLSYSPAAVPTLFANPLTAEVGESLSTSSRYAVIRGKLLMTGTTATLEHDFSVRSQLAATGGYRYSRYFGATTPASDWSTSNAVLTYRYRVTSAGSLRGSYEHRRASYGLRDTPDIPGVQPSEHRMLVGGVLERANTSDQRTFVSLRGGTSVFTATTTNDRVQVQALRFVFDAAVAHQFGRTWLLAALFDRGSQFNQGYGGPLFADSVYASATGFFSDRMDLTASVAHTRGRSILTIAEPRFITTSAGARFRVALSRQWALSAEYLRYHYDFSNQPLLPAVLGVPNVFRRNSIRGGVSMYLPVSAR
jgi:hypothetical protein